MPEIPDLWPQKIGAESSVVTPLAILRTAAAQLGERTQQLIVGDVGQQVYGNKFQLDFYIDVPSMDHYKFKLFSVEHDVDSFYPATGHVASRTIARPDVDLTSDEDLQNWLKDVFSSPRTTKLVNTILKQLRS